MLPADAGPRFALLPRCPQSSSGATFALKMPQYILRLSDEANRWVCEPVTPPRASGRRLLARKQTGKKKGKAAPAPKPKPKPAPKPKPKPAAKPTPAAAPAPPRGPTPAGMRCKDPFALWGVPDKARLALITRQLAGIVASECPGRWADGGRRDRGVGSGGKR